MQIAVEFMSWRVIHRVYTRSDIAICILNRRVIFQFKRFSTAPPAFRSVVIERCELRRTAFGTFRGPLLGGRRAVASFFFTGPRIMLMWKITKYIIDVYKCRSLSGRNRFRRVAVLKSFLRYRVTIKLKVEVTKDTRLVFWRLSKILKIINIKITTITLKEKIQ